MTPSPSTRVGFPPNQRGTSLIEAVIAAAIVTTMAAGVAHLIIWARHEAWSSGVRSMAVIAAGQKLEQLRALAWYVDAGGTMISDETTSLAEEPHTAQGRGLQPGGSLTTNMAGYVDYVDAQGRWCGTGVQPPPCAMLIRRWAVEPFGADSADARVLRVAVLHIADGAHDFSPRTVSTRTIRTRVAR